MQGSGGRPVQAEEQVADPKEGQACPGGSETTHKERRSRRGSGSAGRLPGLCARVLGNPGQGLILIYPLTGSPNHCVGLSSWSRREEAGKLSSLRREMEAMSGEQRGRSVGRGFELLLQCS